MNNGAGQGTPTEGQLNMTVAEFCQTYKECYFTSIRWEGARRIGGYSYGFGGVKLSENPWLIFSRPGAPALGGSCIRVGPGTKGVLASMDEVRFSSGPTIDTARSANDRIDNPPPPSRVEIDAAKRALLPRQAATFDKLVETADRAFRHLAGMHWPAARSEFAREHAKIVRELGEVLREIKPKAGGKD